jgi:hypothetical protein
MCQSNKSWSQTWLSKCIGMHVFWLLSFATYASALFSCRSDDGPLFNPRIFKSRKPMKNGSKLSMQGVHTLHSGAWAFICLHHRLKEKLMPEQLVVMALALGLLTCAFV